MARGNLKGGNLRHGERPEGEAVGGRQGGDGAVSGGAEGPAGESPAGGETVLRPPGASAVSANATGSTAAPVPRRRRRSANGAVPLTRERIEIAALALIERDGLDAFSTRKLAAELGCEAMSIYHHYPSKAHLTDALVDRVLAELPPVPDLPWGEKLRRSVHDWRQMALRHPRFYGFMALHRLNTPGGIRAIAGVLAVVREGGLDTETTARLFRAIGYYVTGASLDETAGYARGTSAAEPVSDAVVLRDYPDVVAVNPFFKPQHHEATFDLGLDFLIAGAEMMAAQQRRRNRG